MRQSTRQAFKAILKEDGYTWEELAKLFVKECKASEMKDFIKCLENGMNGK